MNEIENVYGETVEFYDLSALSQIGNKKIVLNKFADKNIVSTVDSLMSWNYQSVEKILNQLTKMHFRTAKLSETLLLAIKAR